MSALHLDWETRSAFDLKKGGAYPYSEHASTDIMCAAWALGEADIQLWTPGMPVPPEIVQHIVSGGEIVAHNAQFERLIWKNIATPRYGWPEARLEQFTCTAAMAAAMGLPRSLDQLAKVLGLDAQKDDSGYRLMLQVSRPRRIEADGSIVWWDTPEKLRRLYEYCKQDVAVERRAEKSMRPLGVHEKEIWLLDQRVNDRGIRVDRELVDAAQKIADEGTERANVVLRQLTNGTVSEVTNHARLTAWLQSQGVETDSVSKASVRELLDGDDLTPLVRSALEARADAGRTSVAKLRSFLDAASHDDRLRGLLLYHAASTGRWGGRLVQPHNFPRGEVGDKPAVIEALIPLVLAGEYDVIDLVAHPIVVVSSMLRAMMTAAPGNELVVADFSGIEARVVNWLAGQQDVLDLFRKLDETHDKRYEPYTRNAMRRYGIPFEQVLKFPHRQLGKAQELGCGFGMGAKKFVDSAKDVYGLTLTPEEAKAAVDDYRASHGAVKKFWRDAENAVKRAINEPGVVQPFGDQKRLRAIVAGAYLYIVLPSGRPLVYAAPRVVMAPPPWGGEDTEQIEYSAPIGPARKWGRERTYGGKLVENIVQAVARDLMADAMLRAEERGYPPILSVHDEVVAEVPAGFGSVKEFEEIMCELPAWADGCPVAAEGWRGTRYRK